MDRIDESNPFNQVGIVAMSVLGVPLVRQFKPREPGILWEE